MTGKFYMKTPYADLMEYNTVTRIVRQTVYFFSQTLSNINVYRRNNADTNYNLFVDSVGSSWLVISDRVVSRDRQ